MGINWGEALERGVSFGVRPKRWVQILVVDFIFISIMLYYALSNISQFMLAMEVLSNPMLLMGALPTVVLLGVVFVIWMLVKLFVSGALIQQCQRERERIQKTYEFTRKRYLPLLVTAFAIGALSFILGSVPVPMLGTTLSMAVSIVFFFALPSVMLKRNGAEKALKEAYNIFMKERRPFEATPNVKFILFVILVIVGVGLGSMVASINPLSGAGLFVLVAFFSWLLIYNKVGDMWALITIVSGIITLIFALPALLLLSSMLLPMMGTVSAQDLAALVMMMNTNMPTLLVSLAVFLAGSSIASTVGLKATVEYYKQVSLG